MYKSTDSLIERINWNNQGLIPAIAQDAETKKVLMLAWMNADALAASLDRGEAITGLARGKDYGIKVNRQAIHNKSLK